MEAIETFESVLAGDAVRVWVMADGEVLAAQLWDDPAGRPTAWAPETLVLVADPSEIFA